MLQKPLRRVIFIYQTVADSFAGAAVVDALVCVS